MFYESKNSLHNSLFKIEEGRDFHFPPHLHEGFELITVKSGEMRVKVDESDYLLTPGKAVLVFPNQLHSLCTEAHSEHLLCIFSPGYVKAYGNVYLKSLPKSNLFSLAPFYFELLSRKEERSPLQIKGLLYSLCAEFDRGAQYLERESGENGLLVRIFRFVETNFAKECSLFSLARELSYHQGYLSRYFKKQTGLRFSDYVMRYRINEGAYLLTNTPKKILDVAMEAGFDSLRSFNRNFKAVTGKTPNEYRNAR